MRDLIAVIPMYNEAGSAASVVRTWAEAFASLGIDWEIRVYDDGSTDGSADAVSAAAASFGDRVRVITGKNRGHGPTVLAGYREAVEEAKWVFQTDSDGEVSPDGFAGLWARRGEFDFLVGRRTGRSQGLARRIVSAVSRLTVRILYGRGVTDVNSPYRLMRSSSIAGLVGKIPERTFAPNVALSGLVASGRLRCHEEPVAFSSRKTGTCSIRRWKLLKAAVRSFAETVEIGLGTRRGVALLVGMAALTVLAKAALSMLGHNYDFTSYEIVADIMRAGADVYANTERYNYAPVWMHVISFLDLASAGHLRLALAIFLGLVDVGIAAVLWWTVSRTAGLLFLLSPLSLYISGFHGQFDNLAVFLALIAAVVLMRATDNRRTALGAVLLGLSLCVKHIFIFFPLWFLFRPIPIRRRLIVLALPVLIFLLSFVPHVPLRAYPVVCSDVRMLVAEWRSSGSALTERTTAELQDQFNRFPEMRAPIGIICHVFLYRSTLRPALPNFLGLERFIGKAGVPGMALILTVLGFLCRRKGIVCASLVYSAAVVVFSPSMADQYLAIPLAFACATCSLLGISYSLFTGGVFLAFLATNWLPSYDVLYGTAVLILGCLLIRHLCGGILVRKGV